MRKIVTKIRAEKREQKNRKRMHMSGVSLKKSSKYAGMTLIKSKNR